MSTSKTILQFFSLPHCLHYLRLQNVMVTSAIKNGAVWVSEIWTKSSLLLWHEEFGIWFYVWWKSVWCSGYSIRLGSGKTKFQYLFCLGNLVDDPESVTYILPNLSHWVIERIKRRTGELWKRLRKKARNEVLNKLNFSISSKWEIPYLCWTV